MILRLDMTPVRYFYRDTAELSSLPPMAAKHRLLRDVDDLVAAVDGENPNCSVRLEAGSETSALFAVPPLGCVATLLAGTEERFVGVLQRVQLTATAAVLGLEA